MNKSTVEETRMKVCAVTVEIHQKAARICFVVIWTDFSVIFLNCHHLSCLSSHLVMSSAAGQLPFCSFGPGAQVLSTVYFLTAFCFI